MDCVDNKALRITSVCNVHGETFVYNIYIPSANVYSTVTVCLTVSVITVHITLTIL